MSHDSSADAAPDPGRDVLWVSPFPAALNGISEYVQLLLQTWHGRPPRQLRLQFNGWRRDYPSQIARTLCTLASASRRQPPPIVHLQYCPFSIGPAAVVVAEAAHRLGLPLVTTIHEERSAVLKHKGHRPHWRLAYPAVENHLLACSDALIVQSEGQLERLPLPHRIKASVIEFGIAACPACAESESTAAPEVGCFGLIQPHKGIDVVIDACASASQELPDLRLRVVGAVPDGAGRGYLRELRAHAERQLGTRALFVENASQQEFEANLHAVGVVCFALRGATQSTTLHRAWGHAKPVVVTNVAGVAELTARERLGAVVPVDDPGAMAGALRALFRDRRQYAEYRQSVLRYVSVRGWSAAAREHLRVYRRVAA